MEQENDLTSITFKLPQSLRQAIESAAEAEHRTVSNWLRVHLPEVIEAEEKLQTPAHAD